MTETEQTFVFSGPDCVCTLNCLDKNQLANWRVLWFSWIFPRLAYESCIKWCSPRERRSDKFHTWCQLWHVHSCCTYTQFCFQSLSLLSAFSLSVLSEHVHLRPTVILRDDAHSVNGSRKRSTSYCDTKVIIFHHPTCKDNTSNDPFSRCKCATIWLQIRNDDHRIQSDYKYKSELQNPEGKKSVLCMASAWWNRARHQWQRDHQGYRVCVVEPSTTPMTTWPPRPRTPSTQRTWTLTRECAALLFVSQVLVVMIHTLHHLAQVCLVRACHVHTWSERISSTLSPPFPSTSSSSHSSFISCTSSSTSSTTLRAVASLCTPPKRVWTLLTTPTSSQVMSPTPTTSRRLTSSLTQSPWPTHSSPSKGSRGRGVRWHRTRGYASRSTPSTCLSLPARRLVCRSVVVVRVRANGAIRFRANRATRWTNWSGAKHRLELCWTDRKSKFSPNVRRKLRNTNSRLIMTEEVYEN